MSSLREYLSGIKTLPAMLNKHSTGADVALLQGLSIQRDRKHCNFADNKNYLVGTVPYLHIL